MPPPPLRYRVELQVDALDKFMRAANIRTNIELVRRMGTVSESYCSKVLSQKLPPNAGFIFGLHRVFPDLGLDDLFTLSELSTSELEDAA